MKKVFLIALPVGAAFAVAAGMRWFAPSGAGAVAEVIALRLHDEHEMPTARAKGAEVIFPEGRLRVTDRGDGARVAHFHVEMGALNACAAGVGATDDERAVSTAEAFLASAFPVFLSHAHRRPELGAVRFHGGEPWAVPGHSGILGKAFVRGGGSDTAPHGRALFAGLTLPAGVHLVKSVLDGTQGAWKRSVELDGETALMTDAAFEAPAPKEPSMVVQFALIEGADRFEDAAARDAALAALKAHPAWFPPVGDCPTLPEVFSDVPFDSGSCEGGRMADCVAECERGEASGCYGAALAVERQHPDEGYPLHLRACALGHPSGCTNAAATRASEAKAVDACALGMFEAVCERSDDPWACVMFGSNVKDSARARPALERGCRLGDEDPACAAAKNALRKLDAAPP